jgi:hypothetical protein
MTKIVNERDPLDWYIEICAICGCQLGPGVGTRTNTGRCIHPEHHSTGGIVVRVLARPISEQDRPAESRLDRITEGKPGLISTGSH